MEYVIIGYPNCLDLEREVQRRCALGWMPQGGIAIAADGRCAHFYQAMTLTETKVETVMVAPQVSEPEETPHHIQFTCRSCNYRNYLYVYKGVDIYCPSCGDRQP